MKQMMKRFWREHSGCESVEYVILCSVVVGGLAVIGTIGRYVVVLLCELAGV